MVNTGFTAVLLDSRLVGPDLAGAVLQGAAHGSGETDMIELPSGLLHHSLAVYFKITQMLR